MKKLTLSVGLLAGILTSSAQDTACTMVQTNKILEFNHKTSKIMSYTNHSGEVFLEVKENVILCLHLYDGKKRVRKVTTYFPNGEEITTILDSKNNEYFSPLGPIIIKISEPKLFFLTSSVK